VRVLIFTGLFPNREQPLQGIPIFQRMAHFAERPGNQVQVIAPVPYFPRWIRWTRWTRDGQIPGEEKIRNLTINHPRYLLLPKISMPLHGLLMFLGSWRTARRLHKQMKFDCIDAHFVYPDGFAAVLLGKLLKVPVIVSARGTDINLYPTFRLIRPLIRWSLSHSAGVVAVSASLREVMLGLGAQPDHIRVIGNGIDLARFSPIATAEARNHLGLPSTGKIIVSVGDLIPRKGFHFLIPALAQIAPRFGDLHLYILGEGDYRSKLEALIQEYKVETRVTLVGSVPNDQLRYWYSAATVSCLASSREGWANVLQESMACGTPVVATRVWGAPEVVVSSELGLLVEQNVQQIAAALELAVTKDWNRRFIEQQAAIRTWRVVAAEVEEFLCLSISRANSARTEAQS
jgi:teichuronic acid biosynthesis glycosyltransferase TuaC